MQLKDQTETLLLKRSNVAELLTIEECIAAVEQAFKLYGQGSTLSPKVLGFAADNGGFHIKAGISGLERPYFVAKVNANFPGNFKEYGLPSIQGVMVVCDATNGRLLALMDSIEITIIRTGAATAVAAKYLALPDANTVTICGCGNQGKISLQALMKVRKLKKAFAFDIDPVQAEKFALEFHQQLEVIAITEKDLSMGLIQSQVCVTCTPSKKPIIPPEYIMPGTFIAAIGADSEEKQELLPGFVATNKIVVDILQQGATIGELHHAIVAGLISEAGVHAELGEIIAGKKPGRESNEEIIIFDSTGTALQDVAAAAIVYEKALLNEDLIRFNFSKQTAN